MHDATYPVGAIKGQLSRLERGADLNQLLRAPLTARLSGAQEVPAAGDPDGRAFAAVRLSGQTTVRFAVAWRGIAQPTAAHIHTGGAGQAGPVVVPFFSATAPTGLPASINGVSGEVESSAAVVAQIGSRPAGYYVNLHNVEFPAGAVRGQLRRGR